MRNIFTTIVCLLWFGIYAQSIKEQLTQVTTIEDAKKFAQENQNLDAQLIFSIPEIENDEFATKLSTAKPGDIFSDIYFTYKILFATKIQAFRVSYIYLDGGKLSVKEIEKLRTRILEDYKNGNAFALLAKKYSMDNSKDGDLGWFSEGTMVPEFETAIKNHKQNDVFKVDVPDKKWYYIVLKTFNDKEVEELSILKIKSST
ncbi:Peptidyl-prolyl cis-trans isomerase C [compost metagenome]